MNNFEKLFKNKMDDLKIAEYNSLTLAFLGDAIYTAFIRALLVKDKNLINTKLHTMSNNYIKSSAQAKTINLIYETLSDNEKDVVRRARNHRSKTRPKNSTVSDYNDATGFEALLGYLFLKGEYDRLIEILSKGYEENVD